MRQNDSRQLFLLCLKSLYSARCPDSGGLSVFFVCTASPFSTQTELPRRNSTALAVPI